MIGLFKRKGSKRGEAVLGELELRVMEILWAQGESNVRAVVDVLDRPLAYTTIMTTLDRLFKKGLLNRRKHDRAFFYWPLFTREEWQQKRAGEWISGFLAGPQASSEALISYLVDAVEKHDEALLTELEQKIRDRRKELERRKS